MPEAVTIRTRKFIRNALLKRRQMVIDVIHPERANVSKEELKASLAKMHKVSDLSLISLFGFRTKYGGGRSTGFGLIYDDLEAFKRFEPKFRQARNKVITFTRKSRKAIKDTKNKGKKVWGTGVRAQRHKAKKNQDE